MDDSGFFSSQVITEALKVWNLDVVPLANPQISYIRNEPTHGTAFICNLREHWFTVRKLGHQWFNLNSLLNGAQLISDTYLSLFLAQLLADQYTIFVVLGQLPHCEADELLKLTPVDPGEQQRKENRSRNKRTRTEDDDDDPALAAALAASMNDEIMTSPTTRQLLHPTSSSTSPHFLAPSIPAAPAIRQPTSIDETRKAREAFLARLEKKE